MALGEAGFEPEAGGVEGYSFGEAQDGFEVDFFGSLFVPDQLGQGHGFVELVELLLVGGLVDGFLEDEGFDELIFAALQVGEVSLGGGSPGGVVFSPGFPDVEDEGAEEVQEFLAGTQALEELEEFLLQLVPGDVGAAAVGRRRAVVVGVALAFALGPGAGEGLAAVAAGDEAPQGEVGVVTLSRDDQAVGGEVGLAAPEGVFVDEGRPVARAFDVPGGLGDAADVEAVLQYFSPFLRGQLFSFQGAEAEGSEVFEDLGFGVEAGGEALEALADEGGSFEVELHALAIGQVAEGRFPDPLAAAQGFLHAGFGAASPDFVVELGEGGEDAFHELAGGGFVDGLADGAEGDAQAGQMPADDGVVEGVAGEAVDVGDDEGVDPHGALVLLAEVGEDLLELGAVGGLGGLSPFQEDAVDVPAVEGAEGPALIFLDREGEVVGLLLAADAAVDDGAEGGHLPFSSLVGSVAG